jgi:hypothetical protein
MRFGGILRGAFGVLRVVHDTLTVRTGGHQQKSLAEALLRRQSFPRLCETYAVWE